MRPLAPLISINIHSPEQLCVSGLQAPTSYWMAPAVPDKDPNLQLRRVSVSKQKQSYICDIFLEDAEIMP